MRPDDDRYIHAPRMMTDGLFLEKGPAYEPLWKTIVGGLGIVAFMAVIVILTLAS